MVLDAKRGLSLAQGTSAHRTTVIARVSSPPLLGVPSGGETYSVPGAGADVGYMALVTDFAAPLAAAVGRFVEERIVKEYRRLELMSHAAA